MFWSLIMAMIMCWRCYYVEGSNVDCWLCRHVSVFYNATSEGGCWIVFISKCVCLICCYVEKSVSDFLLSRAAQFLIYRFVEGCMCGYMFDRIVFVWYLVILKGGSLISCYIGTCTSDRLLCQSVDVGFHGMPDGILLICGYVERWMFDAMLCRSV